MVLRPRRARQLKEDWATHLASLAGRVADAAMTGDMRPWWGACARAKRRSTCRNPPLDVVKADDGRVLVTVADRSAFWLDAFVEEFGSRADVEEWGSYMDALLRERAAVPTAPLVPWARADWEDAIWDQILAAPRGKSMGLDCVPNELMQAGGGAYASKLGHLAHRVAQAVTAPAAWRGGAMAKVRKKHQLPLSRTNFRGVLTASHPAKAYAGVVLTQISPQFELAALDSQPGGIPHRGVGMAAHTSRLFFRRLRRRGRAGAALHIDLVAAFYRCLPEVALRPLATT